MQPPSPCRHRLGLNSSKKAKKDNSLDNRMMTTFRPSSLLCSGASALFLAAFGFLLINQSLAGDVPTIEISVDLSEHASLSYVGQVGVTNQLGFAVSSIGDFNGDGYEDFMFSDPGYIKPDNVDVTIGAVKIITGNNAGEILFTGEDGSNFGYSVCALGDINQDGFADLAIGVNNGTKFNNRPESGYVYILYGTDSPNNAVGSTPQDSGYKYKVLVGASEDEQCGSAVSLVGDVNDNGSGELAIGCSGKGVGGGVYVLDLSQLDERNENEIDIGETSQLPGVLVMEVSGDIEGATLGTILGPAGDVNNDGVDDFFVAAQGLLEMGSDEYSHGAALIIYGDNSYNQSTGNFLLSNFNPTATPAGFLVVSKQSDSADDVDGFLESTNSMCAAGDFNGDGISDLALAAQKIGIIYIIYGKSGNFDNVDVKDFPFGLNGMKISGEPNNPLGLAVAGLGDINQDGVDDILVSCNSTVYCIYGRAELTAELIDIGNDGLTRAQGFNMTAPSGQKIGFSLSRVGDLNGDGVVDIMIGAPDFEVTYTPSQSSSESEGVSDLNENDEVEVSDNEEMTVPVGAVFVLYGPAPYSVLSGPASSSVPRTYTCQEACASYYGGLPSEYSVSKNFPETSNLCLVAELRSDEPAIFDSFEYGEEEEDSDWCDYYKGAECQSAFVNDPTLLNESLAPGINYCYRTMSSSEVPSTMTCPSYYLKDSDNANNNYVDCEFQSTEGDEIKISACSTGGCLGDQFIKLYTKAADGDLTYHNESDDGAEEACGVCASLHFTNRISTGTFVLRMGCYGVDACFGEFTVSGITGGYVIGSPTATPTVGPTLAPIRPPTTMPSPRPSRDPTPSPSASPSFKPSAQPTANPTTHVPTPAPSSAEPTHTPTEIPTVAEGFPSPPPTLIPSRIPSAVPTTPRPSTHPSLDPNAGFGQCPPYQAVNSFQATSKYSECTIQVCPGYAMTASGCGACTGDQYIALYNADGVEVAQNDDGCDTGVCSSLNYSVTGTECEYLTLREGCASYSECSGVIDVTQGVVLTGTAQPSSLPTLAPTTPAPTAPNNTFIGAYQLRLAPAWTKEPQTYTCQEACAVEFGGSAGEYQVSIDRFAVTRTCHAEVYLGDPVIVNDAHKQCEYFSGRFCLSAYVAYRCKGKCRNYCFILGSSSASDVDDVSTDAFDRAVKVGAPRGAARWGQAGGMRTSSSGEETYLDEFYSAAGGSDWFNSTNWGADAGTRFGVGTDAASGLVTHIGLSNNRLTGYLHLLFDSLIYLTSVEYLDLSMNDIEGYIPEGIAHLKRLTTLWLHTNLIGGGIPATIGAFTNMSSLMLYNNYINGSLPASVGGMGRLAEIGLYGNDLTGSLPETFGDLTALSRAYLDSNSFTGSLPESLSKMQTLERLFISNNHLSGTISASLSALTTVEYLLVGANSLVGTLPAELSGLKALFDLDVSDNSLTGAVPESLCERTRLGLNIESVDVCYPGCLSKAVSYGTDTTSFDTARCLDENDMSLCNLAKLNISDAIATVPSTRISIGESAHPDAEGDRTVIRLFAVDNALSYLVSFDGWTDEVESVHFCKTATCTDFGANPNDIYGVFENFDYPGKTDFVAEVMYINASTFYMIMGLRCVKTEEALGLCWGYEFHVEATVANRGWRCTSPKQAGARAQSLSIEGSKSLSLTHEFMSPRRKFAELGAAASDDSYAENYCEWTGVTCDADEEVISIILESYGMSGTLPDIFTSFTRMHTLDLSGNELSGTLPSSISKLISLETLDLSSNLLNGNISVLSHLNPETMKFVYLYGNFLSGSIPAELDALKKLDSLILSNNDFSGKLAQEMCDLSTTYVDVSGNEMDCYDPCWEDASAEQFKGGTLSICAPTSVPTSQPSRPTMAPSGELLSSLTYDELATIFSMSGTTFFVVIILCSYMFIYKPRIDYVKKRDLALEVLPIHSAIVHGHSEEKILALIKEHQETLNFRDYDNKTAFDWCVEYGSSDDLVQAIVEACLPLPQGDSVYPPPPDMHGFVWATVVQYDQYADVVEKVLTAHAEQALDLARSRDEEGRSAMNIASPENHTILHSFLHFYRQYELIMAPTESVFYKSESSIIQLAIDHGIRGQNNTPVALKFIAKRDDFNRECYTRAMIELDDEYVVPFIRVHDSDIDNNFLRAVRHCDMGNYPYCVVMPVGERTLKTIMMTEHIAGTEWHQIKLITSQLAVAIKHIHDRGFTHGDVSPSNIVRMGGKMKLIDLDSSAILGSGFSNTKKSTAHLPPEMFFDTGKEVLCRRVVMNATNMPYSLVPAAVSHDVWSMGMVLFELFTGFPFFLADVDENLDQEDMRDLLNFEDGYKFDKLKAIKQPLARNFLSEILVRDPAKRPTMDTILMHPFMTGEFKRKVGAELHDVVIAYRSGDDISIAERVAEELRAKGLTVWYKDMPGIPPDQSMELLNDAMMNCRVYTPILTRNSINNPTDKSRNFAELKQKDRDGYLHQMWFALELKARGFINEIYPLLSGDVDPATGSVRHYFASGSHPNVTKLDFVLLREEKDVNDQLDDLGLGTPLLENMTVKQIMNDVTQHQGSIPQGPFQQAFNGAVDDMVKICERQEIKNRESMASRATEVSRPSEVYGLSRSSSAVSDADAVALQMPAAEIGDPGFAGDVEMQTMNPIVSSLLKSTNKSKKSNKAGGGGLKKGHDVVIVVGEEAGLAIASQLNMYLARAGLKCWMQSYASAQVMDLKFMDDFIDVIKGAPVFLPVFTRGAIKDPPNGAADAYADALLYALRLSYELLALNHLGSIFPVWVGDIDTESSGPGTSIIIDYFASKCLPTLQDGVVDQRAEMKVSAMFMKHNLGRQKSDRMEVKSLIEQVIEMQGHRFKGDLDESFEDVVEGVTELIEDLGASWGFSFN